MTSGPRRFRSGYRSSATDEWVLGASEAPDAVLGYYDPDADQWTEGIADIESGEWIPVDAVRPSEGRDCPTGYPIKGNLPSRVFHSPGQANYDRTTPEVCFTSEAAARDAGFRSARLGAAATAAAAPIAAAPVAAAAPIAAATAPRPDADAPTPPPPPRPTAPPPPQEPDRNWLWWILGALVLAALLWWFFFRPQQQPAAPVEPNATVSAPAAKTPAGAALVATPAKASPVSGRATPVRAAASPVAVMATPIQATAKATPRVATAVADAVETAEAELEGTETP
jgi:hypothetical protein